MTILVHKEIFARRICQLPMIRWILEELQTTANHHLSEDRFLRTLEDHFAPDEAERQLDLVINWERYAELFEFDDDRDELYLPNRGAIQQT